MTIRTQLKAGYAPNHNETLRIRSEVKAGRAGGVPNHNETLRVRSTVKAGGLNQNHSEARRFPLPTAR